MNENGIPGSSPHTRDKFTFYLFFFRYSRIIPAYAGQIMKLYTSAYMDRDHPRIRGTNSAFLYPRGSHLGSSPHTRDKCQSHKPEIPSTRIIPAYAGQIIGLHFFNCGSKDHPRIRGTNKSIFLIIASNTGSSPHTRDKFWILWGFEVQNGIIPAYAGQIRIS